MIDALGSLSSLSAARGIDTQIMAPGTRQSDEAKGTSFSDLMAQAATSVVGDLQNAETMSYKGISGEATTREVVDAVMSADRSLQTAIAFRDKVVNAYLEISKMPI